MDKTVVQASVRGHNVNVALGFGSFPKPPPVPSPGFPHLQIQPELPAHPQGDHHKPWGRFLCHHSITLSLPHRLGEEPRCPGDICPDGRVRLASVVAGAKRTAVQRLHISEAVGPFPRGVSIGAGGRSLLEPPRERGRARTAPGARSALSTAAALLGGPRGREASLAVSICCFLTLAFLEKSSFNEKEICRQAETSGVENSSVS